MNKRRNVLNCKFLFCAWLLLPSTIHWLGSVTAPKLLFRSEQTTNHCGKMFPHFFCVTCVSALINNQDERLDILHTHACTHTHTRPHLHTHTHTKTILCSYFTRIFHTHTAYILHCCRNKLCVQINFNLSLGIVIV